MRLLTLTSVDDARARGLLDRSPVPDPSIRARAGEICASVRAGGDRTLAEFGETLGGGRVPSTVAEAEIRHALDVLDSGLRAELESAIAAVRTVHGSSVLKPFVVEALVGVRVERRWSPLERVGAYVPGGGASYPSTLIMTVVPALQAGVAEVAVATPAAPDGSVPEIVLATAALLGVTEIHAMGGAQAIAALAYGTETIRPVQKIVGPGNAWVTAAKLAVFGDVSIDLPAGPSEAVIIADAGADPRLVAVDLLCQAEHGPESPVLLLTDAPKLAERAREQVDEMAAGLERRDILEKSLADHGVVAVVPDLETAVAIANAYAPEHVSVLTADAAAVADRVVNAGSVYVGVWSPESAGDYATGANHVLPTGGLAASHGPLSVEDFGSWRQIQTLSAEGLRAVEPTISALAAAEGLTAHALAARLRLDRVHEDTGGTP